MLALFPNLLTYALVAPVILRLAAALGLSYHGYKLGNLPKLSSRVAGISHLVASFFLLIGLWTQLVAPLLAILIFVWPDKTVPQTQRWLMAAILLSLLFTGPGLFAIDLPL